MKRYAIIVAGGKGLRMGHELPKQFLPIGDRPVLMHSLQAFHLADPAIDIILVLPEDQFSIWKELCRQQDFTLAHRLVAGGHHRFDSVKNGLQIVADEEGLVAIHDGVRPFVSSGIILNSYQLAAERGNAVASMQPKDSVRYGQLQENKSLDRDSCYLVQTPQTFRIEEIKSAYQNAPHSLFTDDASVLEWSGGTIQLMEGSYTNIKITTPEDLLVAETILAETKKASL